MNREPKITTIIDLNCDKPSYFQFKLYQTKNYEKV